MNAEVRAVGETIGSERDIIMQLARTASLEMTVHDVAQLQGAKESLGPARRIYVSHLPKQEWSATIAACGAIRSLGAVPVPHLPVRCVPDSATLQQFLGDCVKTGVEEVLLISGDYPEAKGPYKGVMDVLRAGVLAQHGIKRISVAGHPEGHPVVAADALRLAEREKVEFADANGLSLSFVTQFFFDAKPFIEWRRQLPIWQRSGGPIRVVAGLAGPAKLTTLLRYAAVCGVGPSMRALSARPTSIGKILTERGPESLVRELANASQTETHSKVSGSLGIHLFSFGGLTRTCAWLAAVGKGNFQMDDEGFVVQIK